MNPQQIISDVTTALRPAAFTFELDDDDDDAGFT